MCQSILINTDSFLFCEFVSVTGWNDGKTIIFVDHHFKFPNRNTGFIFKVNQWKCKHVFPNCKLEGNFSTYVFE